MLLLQKKIQTSWLKTLSRGCVRTQLCLWCWPCSGCFRWLDTLSPSWIPCGSCFGVSPYPFYFFLSFVSSVRLLGGLYGDVPSDVINVYQPPGTDICITFKSPLMRGRFRWYQSRKLAVGRNPRIESPFSSLSTLELFLFKPFSHTNTHHSLLPVPDG